MAVDKSEQRVRRMFGQIADRYDFLNHFLSGGADVYWRWRTVRAASPHNRAPILDVCTGTGDLALAYWKRSGCCAPVIGTDFTHEMLVRALAKRPAGAANDISFVEADTQRLPFPNDRFQTVCVAFGLRNVTDTRRGLREMIRVCQPGGQVVVLEFSEPENGVMRRLYHSYFKYVLPRIGQFVARNQEDAYNYLPTSVSEFPHGTALAELMTDCGLDDVIFRPLTFGIATLYYGRKGDE